MRLIDKDERIEWAHKQGGEVAHYANVILQGANVVDAVPVIRCKDCKYYKVEDGPCPAENASDSYYSWIPDPDWFCADGERQDVQ